MTHLKTIYSLLRVSHWSKAVFVFLGVIYAKNYHYLGDAFIAALAFSLIASAVYIYNDIQDILEDRIHPTKHNRPLARHAISMSSAYLILIILLLTGLLLGLLVSTTLAAILGCYLLVNLAYNHLLKSVIILDVICIASGFLLRVLAGTIGIGLSISWWITITVTLLSFFIALGKRRLEIQLGLKKLTRRVLKKYNEKLLQGLMLVSGVACWFSYLLYTIYPKHQSFYFILTLPFAAFALWRFFRLTARAKSKTDDPVNLFLSDKLSCINLFCFIILTLMALN